MGMAMNKCGVVIPSEITKQFTFRSWIMLKMFLGAVVMSCTSTTLEYFIRTDFESKFRANIQCRKQGYPSVLLGSFLLGVGMLVAGSCPGTVFAQMGSGIQSSIPTFGGGLAGALVFGLLEPLLASFRAYGKWGQSRTLDELLGVKFSTASIFVTVMCIAVIVLLELFAYPPSPVIAYSTPGSNPLHDNVFTAVSWHPVIGGLVLGSLQGFLMQFGDRTLGTSSSYVTIDGALFVPLLTNVFHIKNKYLEDARNDYKSWYQVLFVASMVGGAAISAGASNTIGLFHGPGAVQAFFGAFLLVFGARLANGCTSGHGISGFALLSLNSILAVVGMFGGAIIVGEITLAAGVDLAAY